MQSFQMILLGAGGPDFKAVANRFGTYPTSSLLETRVSMFVLE